MKKHSEIEWSKLVRLGRALVGKPYILGAEVDLNDPNPEHIKALDCSELVELLFHQIGITVPDGSYNQAKVCRKTGASGYDDLLVGDLAFKAVPETGVIHHVGIFIGDNTILEAKGRLYGTVLTPVEQFKASSHFAYFARLNSILDS